MNAANDFKDQRRTSSRQSTVMFRGTLCIYLPESLISPILNKLGDHYKR